MMLAAFVGVTYLPSRIELSPVYSASLRTVVRRFSESLGHPAALADLNEPAVWTFLAEFRSKYTAAATNNQRRMLLAIWRSAFDEGLVDRPPRKIRKLPESVDPPTAWTLDECGQLFGTAEQLPGMVGDIRASDWWLSLLLTAYWTACRIGALMATPVSCYSHGRLLVRKQKNHHPDSYTLPVACCDVIDATLNTSRLMLWPWPHGRRHLFTSMRRIVTASGLTPPPGGRQLFHRLRRTTLSHCAAVDPAIAQRQAGHASYLTTLRHYIDPSIARGLTAADVLPDPRHLSQHPLRIVG